MVWVITATENDKKTPCKKGMKKRFKNLKDICIKIMFFLIILMWKPDGLQSAEMRLLKSASGGFWDVGKSINKWMKREWIQEKNWFWKTTTNIAQKYV